MTAQGKKYSVKKPGFVLGIYRAKGDSVTLTNIQAKYQSHKLKTAQKPATNRSGKDEKKA